MISREDSAYRLLLARRYLDEAEQDVELNRWRSAVEAAQLSIENSAKSIVACFGPVPRSHDLAGRLQAVTEGGVPPTLAEQVKTLIPVVLAYGTKLHMRASYGDEEIFCSPWELFGEEEAGQGVKAARHCLTVAESMHNHFFHESQETGQAESGAQES